MAWIVLLACLLTLSGVGCGPDVPSAGDPRPRVASGPKTDFETFFDGEPVPNPESAIWKELPPASGRQRFDLTFERWDEETVSARLVLPQGASKENPAPLIYYFHRAVETRESADAVAAVLSDRGFAVLAADHPSIRRHSMTKGRDKILETVVLSRDAVVDARDVFDFVRQRGDVDPRRVVAVGASQGSNIAVITGALIPEIRGVASIVGGGNRSRGLKEFNLPERKAGVAGRLFDSVDADQVVSSIAPRSFLMINAKEDEVVERERAEALYRQAKDPKGILWIAGGHRFPFETLKPLLLPWLVEVLGA